MHGERPRLSPGRYWIETSSPQADRVSLDFELQAAEPPPRVLLLGAGASGLTALVQHADVHGGWPPIGAEEVGGGHRRRLLRFDSIMVSVYLLTAAALCLYLHRRREGAMPPFGYHLLVHLAFALWFLMRPDGVVGWAAVSLMLYWRTWRYLVLPAALYLAIGISWGAYKFRYTGEFSMTTNTVGDNAWIGLWQVPHKFRWQTADASYFAWAAEVGVPPTSKRASDTALREVLRFTATYPVYVMHLALHKFLGFVDVNVFNGILTSPRVVYEAARGPVVWALLAVMTVCLSLRHEARRTLFLGWPLLFNLPLLLLFFSDDMRHVAPSSAAPLVAAIPPLLEPAFYRVLWRRRRTTLAVAVVFVAGWYLLHWADQALLASSVAVLGAVSGPRPVRLVLAVALRVAALL